MGRQAPFNHAKRRNQKIRKQKRNGRGNDFVKCDPDPEESCVLKSWICNREQTAHLESMSELLASGLAGHQHLFNDQAVQFMATRMCTYCSRTLEDDDCHIDDLCNQLCCDSCLFCPARSESWWGHVSKRSCPGGRRLLRH